MDFVANASITILALLASVPLLNYLFRSSRLLNATTGFASIERIFNVVQTTLPLAMPPPSCMVIWTPNAASFFCYKT